MPGSWTPFAHSARCHTQPPRLAASVARSVRSIAGTDDAWRELVSSKAPIEAWTIPFHVIMWTVLLAGLIMVIVVLMMNA